MGSGAIIQRAIKKYGLENFEKVILETFENAEDMYAKEKEIVTDEFLLREDVYNLRRGGLGGWDYINKEGLGNQREHGILGGLATKEKLQNDPILLQKIKDFLRLRNIEYHKSGILKGFTREQNIEFAKRANTLEAKLKRKNSYNKIKFQQGKNNSQFGTCWIWHELIGNKKIKKELLPLYLDQGSYKMYKPGYRCN